MKGGATLRKNRSFKMELILSFLTITLVSITILGIFQIIQLSSLIKENQKSQIQLTRFLEDYIASYIQDHQKVIQTNALNIRSQYLSRDIPAIQNQLKDIKNNYPGFVNLYVGDIDGQSIVFYPPVYTDGVKRGNLNFSDRSYYKQLMETKDTVISSVFHGRGGTDILLVTIVSPILNEDGDMTGYMLGALDLNALSEHIKNRIYEEEGYAVVLDNENNVVVHPEVDTKRELVNLSDSKIVQYIHSHEEQLSGNYFLKGKNGAEEYVTFAKIDSLGWTAWIGNPAAVITKTYKQAILTIIMFLILTTVILIGVSVLLSNRIEKTLSNLLKFIKDYTYGVKGEPAIKQKNSSPKEMEELFYYFNKMIQEVEKNKRQLIQLNTELEGRVRERTATLESKNVELKAVNKLITSVSAELKAILESMSEGVMLLNNEKQVEYVNEFFLKIITKADIVDTNELTELADVYERFVTLFDVDPDRLRTFFENHEDDIKLVYRQKMDKDKYYMLHKFFVMLDEECIGEGLLLRDITKEEEIDTLKNNLISLTSHEFKTPITNIKGSVETLLRSDVEWDPEFQQELLIGVHEDIERILHLVNDWMDISKIESGTMYVERDMIRADYVIDKSIEQIPLQLREHAKIVFQNKIDHNPYFFADKSRIQQVLVNLFTNALRYNDSIEKIIKIVLQENNDELIITISDNGIGISADHITKIFNRFYQVDVTATRRMGGTGLGLAICRGIMEAHEGRIEVTSELGEGSTFTLYFPLEGEDFDEK